MSADRLKTLMKAEDKRIIDIASELRISPITVTKYLNGQKVSHAIKALIENYLASRPSGELAAKAIG